MVLATDLAITLGISYSIIQAPMAGGATTPELIAAVSNAGGLGSLAAGYLSAADIREAIQQIRVLTDRPFAVNLFVPEKHAVTREAMQKACAQVGVSSSELALKIEPVKPPYAPSFRE